MRHSKRHINEAKTDMKSMARRFAGTTAVCLLCLAVGLTLGCRKSTSEEEQEQKEQKVELKQKSETLTATQQATEREYQEVKEMVKRGEYQEAWEKLEALAETDKDIEFRAAAYKKNDYTDELFRQADELSDIRNEHYKQAYERLMWVQTHIESKREEAAKKAAVVVKKAQACELYRTAVNKIRGYRGGEAVALLEKVKNEYADTDYAKLAEERLREIQGPPPDSAGPD